MPTTPFKNLVYSALLPMCVSPKKKMTTEAEGRPFAQEKAFLRLMEKHHVLGASLLVCDGIESGALHVSVGAPVSHEAGAHKYYRVASITKMATATVVMRLWDLGMLTPEDLVVDLVPELSHEPVLEGVTVSQLLSHTSGLQDTPAYERMLAAGRSVMDVLHTPGIRVAMPGTFFCYSNFGFGLLGAVIESVTGEDLQTAFSRLLFKPLGLDAVLDASLLNEEDIMPIRRVTDRRGTDVRVTKLGSKPLGGPAPLKHFGHTAGALYITPASLDRLVSMLADDPDAMLLMPDTLAAMQTPHAAYGPDFPTLRYGWGLLLIDDPKLSPHTLIGHQGFAYGCVDGAFFEKGTGRRVVFVNGGASEARTGRLGRVNADVLRLMLKEELYKWQL